MKSIQTDDIRRNKATRKQNKASAGAYPHSHTHPHTHTLTPGTLHMPMQISPTSYITAVAAKLGCSMSNVFSFRLLFLAFQVDSL